MLCPKCGSDDVDMVSMTNRRMHFYCFKCRKGFYVLREKWIHKYLTGNKS